MEKDVKKCEVYTHIDTKTSENRAKWGGGKLIVGSLLRTDTVVHPVIAAVVEQNE